MAGYLNIGSLLLGLIAWILPVVTLLSSHCSKKWVAFSMMSFSACAIALFFQILYSYHLVKIEDWSALMDITGAVAFAAAVLLVATILLNAMTLIVCRNRTTG
ncbi:hypothetical protein [Halobacillus andaensis]|uniref:hypothetical protein n=1 Tax=Halobacillus andaensis TaxID=1176239 RepID=UPI003D709BF9